MAENEITESDPIAERWRALGLGLLAPTKRVTLYLPMLAGPLAACIALIYCKAVQAGPDGAQAVQALGTASERFSPMILTLIVGLYWGKAIFTRNLTYTVLAVLAGVLLLRELHWKPELEGDIDIKDAVFPLLGICFAWLLIWMWWGLVDRPMENWLHTVFFYGAIFTYAVGQLVEKRLFKFLPGEHEFHTQMEESIEITGHCLLFLAALLGSWRSRQIIVKRTAE